MKKCNNEDVKVHRPKYSRTGHTKAYLIEQIQEEVLYRQYSDALYLIEEFKLEDSADAMTFLRQWLRSAITNRHAIDRHHNGKRTAAQLWRRYGGDDKDFEILIKLLR